MFHQIMIIHTNTLNPLSTFIDIVVLSQSAISSNLESTLILSIIKLCKFQAPKPGKRHNKNYTFMSSVISLNS